MEGEIETLRNVHTNAITSETSRETHKRKQQERQGLESVVKN